MSLVMLGSEFRRPEAPVPPPAPDPAILLYERVLAALGNLQMALANLTLPAPIVNVEEPKFEAIVQAILGLQPNAIDYAEMAAVVREAINIPAPVIGDELVGVNQQLLKTLKDLEFRMKGAWSQAFGASGPANISDNPNRQLGLVTVLNPNGPPPMQTRLIDYDVRSDANPVYIGVAPFGSATSASVWLIQKLSYDGSARITEQESLINVIWDNRASLGW